MIRYAELSDLAAVAELERKCFTAAEAASEESFALRLKTFKECFWLLCIEGQPVSFVNGMYTNEENLTDEMYGSADLYNADGRWLMIFGVDTDPDFRRKGYAAQVLNAALSDASRKGKLGAVLTCREELLHYYEKFGFVNEGVSKSTHGGGTWYQMRRRSTCARITGRSASAGITGKVNLS